MERQLVGSGRFVIDDYYDFPGCRRAIEEAFGHTAGLYEFVGVPDKARLHLIKTTGSASTRETPD
jgi:hypothetical protein